MMSQRVYYEDAFTRHFTARVVEQVDANGRCAVVLDQTYFYPTSGGQPHDTGTIAGMPVHDVTIREDDGAILHWMKTAVDAPNPVSAKIDWPRRFDHMQQHTGQHILSQAFLRVAEAPTVSFHLSANSVTIDLHIDALTDKHLHAAEQLANDIVWQNRPVHVKMVTPAEAETLPLRAIPPLGREKLRLIEIDEFDLTACGGTHVRHTGAVGLIKLIRTENRRDQTRVEFCCGGRALQDYHQKHTIVASLMAALTTGAEELLPGVGRLQAENKEAQRTIRQQQDALATFAADRLLQSAEQVGPYRLVTAVRTEGDHNRLRGLAQQLTQTDGVYALLALGGERSAFVFGRAANAPGDVSALLRETLQQANAGSGGGSPQMAQGGGPPLSTETLHGILKTAVANLKRQLADDD